ncbi:MAG: ribosome recycling factor [Candidatus Tectomicrobia bacterium]|nr:ribosome recycling factor [Candidatus Tectomicrobia bacterium]
MLDEVYRDIEVKMDQSVSVFRKELNSIRTGRASLALFDGIMVSYYGTPTPLNQLATLAIPESRLITIQPWDSSVTGEIEKAILKSNLGLTPTGDGKIIRITIPLLTEERRRDLVKLVRKKAEECKVAIRNVRREGNELLKSREKKKEMTEDELAKGQERVQKLTDRFIETIDDITSKKEKEVLEV